jgi:hypothetical protein
LFVVHGGRAFKQRQGRFQENADYSALQMTRQRFCGAVKVPLSAMEPDYLRRIAAFRL